MIDKKFEKQLADFDEEEYRQLEYLKDLFEFLDDIIPLEDDDDEPPRKGRKRCVRSAWPDGALLTVLGRRSMSVATTTTTSAATSGDRTPPPSPKSRSKYVPRSWTVRSAVRIMLTRRTRRRRLSYSDDDDDDDDDERGSPAATPIATRSMPRRNA